VSEKTILIAGATGSIGGAAALALAKRGAKVVLLGRNQKKLDLKASRIRISVSESGINTQDLKIETLVIDFSDFDSIKLKAADALDRFSAIDALVLSVGVFKQNGPNILSNGHELMFATNVIGPYLFIQLLMERLQQSNAIILHVIAPFNKELDWDDLESIKKHKPMVAFNRTKTCNRIFAGELARKYAGKISSVAFDPTYVIDKTDPDLHKRWPSGLRGFFWKVMTLLFAKPPSVAGEPIATLILDCKDRNAINGTMFKLEECVEKPDIAMFDKVLGKQFWDTLAHMTELSYK
jgi:NAD(P)-dependent dehydrogenase (short-subunit alcohol dehydrogenase family)